MVEVLADAGCGSDGPTQAKAQSTKTRPVVVLLAENPNAPRSLITHIPITRQN
jgi:hypothetical protein